MNEKDLYKNFNNILIDAHEFDDIEVCMTDIQKSKLKGNLKKKLKNRKFVYSKMAAACAVVLIILIGISYANPSFAAQLPLLNPIVEMLGRYGDYAKYSDIVNKSVSYNGKSFTVNSVICFDNNIIIGYTAESNSKIISEGPLFFPSFKVNGKQLRVGWGGGKTNLSENKVMGTIELMSTDMTLPNNFNFDMSFDKLDGTVGKWDFKFNISKAELSKNTKTYKPNQVITYGKYNFTISKVSLNPLNTLITNHSSSEEQTPFTWIVLDDKGNELTQDYLTGKVSSDGFNSITSYSKIDTDTKYITLVPPKDDEEVQNNKSTTTEEPQDISVPINTKLPIQLSQGKDSNVTLTKINFSKDNNDVIIEGIIYGKLPIHQTVFLEGDNPKADIACLNTTIKKISTDKYEFTREYSGLKNDKNYKLITYNIDNIVDYDSRVTVILK